ncbi:MAG TPA: type III polyketide synthase [Ignavibacteriaceae bacterium]|nr:type III polyketide synthase [Ignavibacteriaceae bacterium]
MIVDIQTSSPPFKASQEIVKEELKKRMGNRPAVSRMIDMAAKHSGIENRFFVVPDGDPEAENKFFSNGNSYLKPDTQSRMFEYEKWSKQLTKNAVEKILKKNNFNASDIERLITISCTGFFAPGLDLHIINEFGIPLAVKRTNIGFMGCAASLVGFNSVLEAMNSVNDKNLNTLMVSVELCSLHLQTEPTRDNILANIVFADGCAAALFSKSGNIKLNLLTTDSVLFKDSSGAMGWKIGNFGFEMMLSSNLPRMILESAVPMLKEIISSKNLSVEKIKHWALHPGGRAILDAMQEGLKLQNDKMIPSRKVLKNFGNMSSASILFVLKEIMENSDVKPGEICCAVAFGPGLTMEVAFLEGK